MIVTAVFCCLLLAMCGCKSRAGLYVEQGTTVDDGETAENAEDDTADSAGTEEEADMIYVQVSGAVAAPGVYKLPGGSRIFEAVELAGGVTEEADVSTLNQALVLSDGQMIYVYAVGEERTGQETGEAAGEPKDGRIDLNTATAEELMTLPGIGQSKAESIISWREENGAFESVEDILNITGIKEGVFSKIKDHIKVN